MAIYKSSFNQKPEKEEKPKQKKEKVEKQEKKPTKKINIKPSAIWLAVFVIIFAVCCFPNNFLKSFLLGVVGLSVYPLALLSAFLCGANLAKKKLKLSKKFVAYISVSLLITWFVFHLILTSKLTTASFGAYLKETYLAKTTAGGLIYSLLSYPLIKLLTVVGAYIISAIALAIFVGLVVDYVMIERKTTRVEEKSRFNFSDIEDFAFDEKPVEIPVKVQDTKQVAKQKLGLEKGEATIISSTMPKYNIENMKHQKMARKDYILTPLDPVIPVDKTEDVFASMPKKSYGYAKINKPQKNNFGEVEEILPQESKTTIPHTYAENVEELKIKQGIDMDGDFVVEEDEDLFEFETAFETSAEISDEDLSKEAEEIETEETADNEDFDEEFDEDNYEDEEFDEEFEDLNDEAEETEVEPKIETIQVKNEEFVDEYATTVDNSYLGSTVETQVVRPSVDISKFNLPNMIKKPVGEEKKEEKPREKLNIPPYVAPPVELLNYMENPVRISDDELQDNITRLEQVLEDFKVPAKVNNVQVGPAVTRYELTMPRGISVNKIAQMADDIAMTLASNGSIRVEAPIPGKNSVGIEVPNNQVSPVSLRELVDSDEFRQRGNPLSFVLGKDINGSIIFCNLDKMPHVLVAGSTGSGKSVCLNTMLLSMCYKAGPQDLRLILVDPKMVEFSTYNGLPHLLIPEVIIGKDLTINALDWAIKEMERRYAMFAQNHVVNINEFNKLEMVKNKREEKLPFIVIVVDELADLMLEAKREIEDRIARLAAKARAAGIHLVLATQRPSVDVITGTVKANLPSRIAFALTNYMDSKTVLDGGGAEKLLGKGDMLFKPQDKPEPTRIQGAYVSNSEIAQVVEYIKEHNRPVYDEDAGRSIKNPHQEKAQAQGTSAREMEFDPVLKEALRMFIQAKQGSASMITRRYSVGFNRAGRIMDQMEMAGFVGPQDGAKPRTVLITMEEYKAIFGEE